LLAHWCVSVPRPRVPVNRCTSPPPYRSYDFVFFSPARDFYIGYPGVFSTCGLNSGPLSLLYPYTMLSGDFCYPVMPAFHCYFFLVPPSAFPFILVVLFGFLLLPEVLFMCLAASCLQGAVFLLSLDNLCLRIFDCFHFLWDPP